MTRTRPGVAALALPLARVDEAEELLNLLHRVVVGEKDLDVEAVAATGVFGVLALESLVILVGAREGDDEALGHRGKLNPATPPTPLGPPDGRRGV